MDFVQFELVGNIGVVTLNRPPVNSLNLQAYDEIRETFQRITDDKNVRVAILRAEGKIFMAGNDVNDFPSLTSKNSQAYTKRLHASVQSVYNCRVPVIAALNGAAVGAGLVFAASCDLIIASERAKVSIPEINVGLVGAGEGLSRLVPHKLVRYLGLTGEFISASDLLHYGGVFDVVPEENLMDRVFEVAQKIERKSPLAIESWKEYLNNIEVINQVQGDSELRNRILFDQEDTKEAVSAYLQKREPVFKG